MKRKKSGTEDQGSRMITRSGRVVKPKAPQLYEVERLFNGKEAKFGRWSRNDKEKLLGCLKRFPGIQYNPLTIFRSVKNKSKGQVERYMGRLRRQTAAHIGRTRKKQPPILTWLQVADEVTWLKEDETLDLIIPTLLGVHVKEANAMQERNPILSFPNLYKYLKMLHKCESLLELTPAESIVLLDCFQQLADLLRASETQPQADFMRNQYQQYFQHLYFAASSFEEGNGNAGKQERRGKTKGKTISAAKPKATTQSQRSTVGPIMKAELRKKQQKGKPGRKKKAAQSAAEVNEGQSPQAGQERLNQNLEGSREGDGIEEEGGRGEHFSEAERDAANGIHERSDVNETRGQGGNRDQEGVPDSEKSRPADGSEEGVTATGVKIPDPARHNLDPDDPDFLAKFADMFSLGSLNPFEIPPDLINFRLKVREVHSGQQDNVVDSITDRDVEILNGQAGSEIVIDLQEKDPADEVHVIDGEEGVPGGSVSASEGNHGGSNGEEISMAQGPGVSSRGMEDGRDHSSGLSSDHQTDVSSAKQPQISINGPSEMSGNPQIDVSSANVVTSTNQPVVTSTNQPVVTRTDRPIVTSPHLSQVSRNNFSDISSSNQPVVTSTNQPVVTRTDRPIVTSPHRSQVSRNNFSDISSSNQPVVTSVSQAEISSHSFSDVPSAGEPVVTSAHQPVVTSVHLSQVSSNNFSDIPSSNQPVVSSASQTVVTSVSQAEIPSNYSSDVPSAGEPVVASAHQPEVTSAHQPEVTSAHQPVVASVTSTHQPEISSGH